MGMGGAAGGAGGVPEGGAGGGALQDFENIVFKE